VIVLDASAVLELLLRTTAGRSITDRISAPEETLHAPHLIDLEVAQVLRRYEIAKTLTVRRATEALGDFGDMEVTRYPHELFLTRIWELRKNATAYDAAYLSLAEALGAPLLTSDKRLAGVPGHRAHVELVIQS
jgi:predicted nucleic acid-binding protein